MEPSGRIPLFMAKRNHNNASMPFKYKYFKIIYTQILISSGLGKLYPTDFLIVDVEAEKSHDHLVLIDKLYKVWM